MRKKKKHNSSTSDYSSMPTTQEQKLQKLMKIKNSSHALTIKKLSKIITLHLHHSESNKDIIFHCLKTSQNKHHHHDNVLECETELADAKF